MELSRLAAAVARLPPLVELDEDADVARAAVEEEDIAAIVEGARGASCESACGPQAKRGKVARACSLAISTVRRRIATI